ncbi:hypothetical protein [Lentibacillus saliphilus]|nr:hypothetical protein [Lentibacillus saliphilus]
MRKWLIVIFFMLVFIFALIGVIEPEGSDQVIDKQQQGTVSRQAGF